MSTSPAHVASCATFVGLLIGVFVLGACTWTSDIGKSALLALPFEGGHAHNAEQHAGLEGSLRQGFCNIEADVFAMDGVFVGHNPRDLQRRKSLQAEFLGPLAKRVEANGGVVYPQARYLGTCRSLTLLIDVKEVPDQTAEGSFDIIHGVLQAHAEQQPGLLTSWDARDSTTVRGAVTVLISGNRPAPAHVLASYPVRYASLDGRESDLDAGLPVDLIPVISKAWTGGRGAVLQGLDPLHPSGRERAAVRELIRRAHAQGRDVRFWGTLDTPRMWQELLDMGVDIISTDDVVGLRAFVASRAARHMRQHRPLWPRAHPAGGSSAMAMQQYVRRMFGRRLGVVKLKP